MPCWLWYEARAVDIMCWLKSILGDCYQNDVSLSSLPSLTSSQYNSITIYFISASSLPFRTDPQVLKDHLLN